MQRCTYDRRSFNFVPSAYRPLILAYEERAAVIRRQITKLADLERAIDAVAELEPIIDVSSHGTAGFPDRLIEPTLAELME